ncbi:MAG: tetratricopeptide repeat protein [Thermoguttaceae bacterium]|jgi:Tfp pilus assembly protein PilF
MAHRRKPRKNAWRRVFDRLVLGGVCVCAGCQALPFHSRDTKDVRAPELSREGVSAFERGEYDLAARNFVQAIKSDENDILSRRYYGEILWREGKKNEAFRVLTDAAGRAGSDEEKAAVCESLAEKFLEVDQAATALHYADKVVEVTPRRHEGWELRAMVCEQIGKEDEALADYHRALRLAPNDRELLKKLALFESRQGDDRAALVAWEELGRTYPGQSEPAEVLCGKAEACRRLGRGREAADFYAAAIKQKPDNPALYQALAEVRLENRDTEGAREIAAQAAERFPDSREALTLPVRVEEIAARTAAQGVK